VREAARWPTPFSGALFAFGNRARMAINVLVYEGWSF
jgi:hypothetical protein